MKLRIATESDFDAILSLINSAFSVELAFKNRDRMRVEELQEHFRDGVFLVYEEDNHLTGCVYVERRGKRAYLGLLSIDPARQKTGLGRLLTAAAEEFARETGARFMDLCVVNLRTELLEIYAKFGYRVTGSEPLPCAKAGDFTQPAHFIQMEKELGHRA
jgi:predicted N-acetyltransferase YhbS